MRSRFNFFLRQVCFECFFVFHLWAWTFAYLLYVNNCSKSRKHSEHATQVEVARPNWALIRPSLGAHMFSVRSNYMVWKRFRAHFRRDKGLEPALSEATLVWNVLIRGHFGLGRSDQRQFQAHTSLPRDQIEHIFYKFFLFFTDICCLW